MKHQRLMILLAFICWSTFEITAQSKDSVSIHKLQIKNIYIGLKQSEAYKKYYYECLQNSDELSQIINNQDQELKKSLKNILYLNAKNDSLNKKIIEVEVNVQKIKNKKIPWYRHPITYGILGFISGIYLMK